MPVRGQRHLSVKEKDGVLFPGTREIRHQRIGGPFLKLGCVTPSALLSGSESTQKLVQPFLNEVGDKLV